MEDEEVNKIKLDVGLMQKDITMIDRVWQKVTDSIEKLQEVNLNLMKMISIHEQKHDQHEKEESELKGDVKELHSRITTVSREMSDRMAQVETHISGKIDLLRDELVNQQIESGTKKKKLSEFLMEFDKYKWMVVGAAGAVGWVVGNVNLTALAHLLK